MEADFETFVAWAGGRGVTCVEASVAEYAAVLQRVAGEGVAVLPKHVDEALRRAEAKQWPAARMAELKRVGDALVAFAREPAPVAAPAPAAAAAPAAAPAPVGPPPPDVLGPLVQTWSTGARPQDYLLLLLPYGLAAACFVGAFAAIQGRMGVLIILAMMGGFGLIGAGTWLQKRIVASQRDRVEVYERALVVWLHGQLSTLPWHEVTEVYDSRSVHVKLIGAAEHSRFLTLSGARGQHVQVFEHPDEVMGHLLAHAGDRLHAEARARLDEGESWFGECVALTRDALVYRDGARRPSRRQPWREIDRLSFEDGVLFMHPRGGALVRLCPAAVIANLPVFLRVCSEECGALVDLGGG